MRLTLDSSVIVAALRKQEDHHEGARQVLNRVKKGEHRAECSAINLVEAVAAIKRRTESTALANRVNMDLRSLPNIIFLAVTPDRMRDASDIASEEGLKGMDAIVVQISGERDTELLTLDKGMVEKGSAVTEVSYLPEF